jgi:hypothetical protein
LLAKAGSRSKGMGITILGLKWTIHNDNSMEFECPLLKFTKLPDSIFDRDYQSNWVGGYKIEFRPVVALSDCVINRWKKYVTKYSFESKTFNKYRWLFFCILLSLSWWLFIYVCFWIVLLFWCVNTGYIGWYGPFHIRGRGLY